jgi:hypothetical protein
VAQPLSSPTQHSDNARPATQSLTHPFILFFTPIACRTSATLVRHTVVTSSKRIRPRHILKWHHAESGIRARVSTPSDPLVLSPLLCGRLSLKATGRLSLLQYWYRSQYIDDIEPQEETEAAPPYDAPSDHVEGDLRYTDGISMPAEFTFPSPSLTPSHTGPYYSCSPFRLTAHLPITHQPACTARHLTHHSLCGVAKLSITSTVVLRCQAHPHPKLIPPPFDLASNRLFAFLCSSTSLHNAVRVVHWGS